MEIGVAAAAPGTTGEVKGERAREGKTQVAGNDIADGHLNDVVQIDKERAK